MAGDSNRTIIERYAKAWPGDYDTLEELRHPDFVEEWPQMRERVVGHAAYRKVHENFPGGLPSVETKRILGSEDQLVLSPSFVPVRIQGTGDVYTLECVNSYPDGNTYYVVLIVELQDGRVRRQSTYFAPPYEAPEWRSQWTERY